ncbi:putative 60S ribosome subunit biogenesis protein NIP7-like isoform X3 [Apostichopus japonicus]|uniref:60S ribosome subunit biogenesis protein NIP7 homolog n=1 Tax=Stichopus japonicus TaxID=307972 RepID=A0A2G8JLJ0_STIJA|nr:putative 60S ribosome subunit biogenesis protein NIP7-like isoform X3 [Apostichopus japonicus]
MYEFFYFECHHQTLLLQLIFFPLQFKVWVKPGSEQSFLYGNHVLKSGLARITENTAKYQGVVIHSMSDVPLGFGVAAKTTQECRHTDPLQIVVFHQADIGEYLRHEDSL